MTDYDLILIKSSLNKIFTKLFPKEEIPFEIVDKTPKTLNRIMIHNNGLPIKVTLDDGPFSSRHYEVDKSKYVIFAECYRTEDKHNYLIFKGKTENGSDFSWIDLQEQWLVLEE
jgi:hypothetical protein